MRRKGWLLPLGQSVSAGTAVAMELGWLRWDHAAQHHGVLRPSQRTFPRGSSSWQLLAPCSSWHHNREKMIPSGVTSAQWPKSSWRQLEKLPRKSNDAIPPYPEAEFVPVGPGTERCFLHCPVLHLRSHSQPIPKYLVSMQPFLGE